MTEEFYIGQIFENTYPSEAAEFCNNRGDCYIDEIEGIDGVRRFEIKEVYKPTEEESIEKRKEEFAKEFFLTSLGYIRRTVTMQDGSRKDFLCDLLPTISMGVNSGLTVNIIAYSEPDFTKDVTDWTEYQHTEAATLQFVQECMLRLSQDFGAITESEE